MALSISWPIKLIGGHWLCPGLVPQGAQVVDIGANRGVFSEAMAREYGARVVAVEPSPAMFNQLPELPNMRKVNVAIADRQGRGTFFERSNSETSSLFARADSEVGNAVEVDLITLPLLFERCGLQGTDVIKVDAEGAELTIFAPCSDEFVGRIGQMCIEFHEWLGVGTRRDVELVVKRLEKAGFFSFSLVRGNYQAVLLVNRRLMARHQYWLTWLRVWVSRGWRYAGKRLHSLLPVRGRPSLW